MYFLISELINVLKESPVLEGVKVAEAYDVTEVNAPMVSLSESPGNGALFPNGNPRLIRSYYQLEVYARQKNGKTALENARTLMSNVDEILTRQYGFTQTGESTFAPYVEDRTVIRGVVRYYALIDTKENIIYQNV